MTLKPLIALAVVAGAAVAGSAAAGTADGPAASWSAQAADQRFDQLDRNHDGSLSRDEANEAHELDTRFSELDADNDGKLSRGEYRVVAAGEARTLPGAATASTPASAASGATRR
jgi:EF hand domain-containing protein